MDTEQMPVQDPGAAEGTTGPGFLAAGRHPVNVGHLVMGVALLGLLTVWALVEGDVVDGDDLRWVLPVPWVLAGVAGLVVLVLRDRRAGVSQRGWMQG